MLSCCLREKWEETLEINKFTGIRRCRTVKVLLISLSLSFRIFCADPTPTFTPAPILGSVLDHWVTNGAILSVTSTSTDIYLAGYFSLVGPRMVNGGPVIAADGSYIPGFPDIMGGTVNTVISDGAGGYYIGGMFTSIAGQIRNRMAHIYSNGSLDPVFNPNANSNVWSLYFNGTSLYAGGSFIYLGGTSYNCNHIAKLDPITGAPDMGFAANFNSMVESIIPGPSGSLYVSGYFTQVNGTARGYSAKIDAATGSLDSNFNPNVNNMVYASAFDGTSVFLGGMFTTVGGTADNQLAKVNGTTGALDTAFPPTTTGDVTDLLLNGTSLYVSGGFANIGGVSRYCLAKLNKDTGTVDTGFNP